MRVERREKKGEKEKRKEKRERKIRERRKKERGEGEESKTDRAMLVWSVECGIGNNSLKREVERDLEIWKMKKKKKLKNEKEKGRNKKRKKINGKNERKIIIKKIIKKGEERK